MACHARKYLGDLNAGNVGLDRMKRPANFSRSIRFHIPCIHLAGRAEQEQEDAVHLLLRRCGAVGLQGQHLGQRKANAQRGHRECAGVQEVSPRHSVAQVNRLIRIQTKHERPRPTWNRM